MEYREGRAYLSQVRTIESLIRQKLLLAEALRASLMPRAIQYDTDKVQTSPADQSGFMCRQELGHQIEIIFLLCAYEIVIKEKRLEASQRRRSII